MSNYFSNTITFPKSYHPKGKLSAQNSPRASLQSKDGPKSTRNSIKTTWLKKSKKISLIENEFIIRRDIKSRLSQNWTNSTVSEYPQITKGAKNVMNRFFDKVNPSNKVEKLFAHFLEKLGSSFQDWYSDFTQYLEWFDLNIPDVKKYAIFNSWIKKIEEKVNYSRSSIEENDTYLSLFAALLQDYIWWLSRTASPKGGSFWSTFFLLYKEVVIANYEIFLNKYQEKEAEWIAYDKKIAGWKEELNKWDNQNYILQQEYKLFEATNKNNELWIQEQSEEIQDLRVKIKTLENELRIKDYEINNQAAKLEAYSKYGNNPGNERFKMINYEQRLDMAMLWKHHTERAKFSKFKRDINKKNVNNN